MKQILVELMQILLAIFVIGGGLIYFGQESMIFFPQPVALTDRAVYKKYEKTFDHRGTKLSGWFVKNEITPKKPLIIYYGGNAEEVSLNLLFMERFATDNFLFVNYRGYGDSEGSPGEKVLLDDALYTYDQIVREEGIDPTNIVLIGRSLGSGVATHVAANRKVGAVVLVTPFDSLEAVAKHHYPHLPVSLMLRHSFHSDVLAPNISTPALIIMGGQDQIIPNQHSQNLANLWGGPKESVLLEQADHNDISNYPAYWQALNHFMLNYK